jgi:hypothetical protein
MDKFWRKILDPNNTRVNDFKAAILNYIQKSDIERKCQDM